MHTRIILTLALLTLVGCGKTTAPAQSAGNSAAAPGVPTVSIYERAVASPGRTDADRERDAGRKPGQVLEFFGIAPGMTVLDTFSGGGYYTEMLSHIVGADGKVVAHTKTPPMPDSSVTKPSIGMPTTVSQTLKFCWRRITSWNCLPQNLMP